MNAILLCPGQGAQSLGMGKSWFESSPAARDVFATADKILADDFQSPISELCFEGAAERLNQTDAAQPALYTCAIASYNALREQFGDEFAHPICTAGLSLGEYTALHLAGVFSFEDGLRLVAKRGKYMQQAALASSGGMVAVTRPTDEEAEQICEKARQNDVLVCANYNAPGQIVLSGSKPACERAVAIASEMGHRATVLTVAGAFHSDLMAPAAERMAEALDECSFSTPKCPVVSNVTAEPHDAEHLDRMKELLVKQIVSPVKWNQSCVWIVNTMDGEFHELAPGKVLTGLMRRINRETKVINHDQPK